MLFLKNTGVIFTITVSTIAINVGLNLLLIPQYGFIGCGIAVLFTYFMKSVLSVVISMKKNKEIRFRTFYLYSIGIISTLVSMSALYLTELNLAMSLSVKFSITLLGALYICIRYKKELAPLLSSFRIKI